MSKTFIVRAPRQIVAGAAGQRQQHQQKPCAGHISAPLATATAGAWLATVIVQQRLTVPADPRDASGWCGAQCEAELGPIEVDGRPALRSESGDIPPPYVVFAAQR